MSAASLLTATALLCWTPPPGVSDLTPRVRAQTPQPSTPRSAAPRPAAPTVVVRAATRLELEKINRVQGGVVLTLKLLDADLGTGIGGKVVHLSILENGEVQHETRATTTKSGSAQIFVPYRSGQYTLKLSYGGDPLYVRAHPRARLVDLSKNAVTLNLDCPPAADLAGRSIPVGVTVGGRGDLSDIPVTLSFLREGRMLRTVSGKTDSSGHFETTVSPRSLGQAGDLVLKAVTSATSAFNSARASQRMILFVRVRTTLSADKRRARIGSALTLRGEVRDTMGPVPNAIVRLHAGRSLLAATLTDSHGRFERTVDLQDLPLGRLRLRAQFVPRTHWRRPGPAPHLILLVEPARPIPIAYFLIPAGATLLFLLALLLVRRRPWQRARLWLKERLASRQPAGGGIVLGRRPSLGALFSASHLTVSGAVRDLLRGTPMQDAEIHLRAIESSDTVATTTTDASGRFDLVATQPGEYDLLATAPGWIPQSLRLTLPHRGELHGLAIRLESVRGRVMRVYADLVRPLLPEPELVRYWTPGETTRHVMSQAPSPPPGLPDLTRLAQRVYYSAEPPGLEAVADAESISEGCLAAQRERP